MGTILLNAVIAFSMAFFMMVLRRIFLSFGKKRKPDASPDNAYVLQPDDTDDDLTGAHGDAPFIRVEEFLTGLRGKARNNTVAAVERQDLYLINFKGKDETPGGDQKDSLNDNWKV